MARGPDLSGAVLDGRYQVIEPIAEGAMGVVYRAERVGLGRAVAIKVMHESLPGQLSSHQRFEREAKLMAKLEHPNCVSVIDFGIHEEKPFVVMDLVRGTSLHELVVKSGRLDLVRAVDITRQVLSGLAHAHELGIVHRDIKPANVMVTTKEGHGQLVRILDFGLARLREQNTHLTTGIVVGTPSYMAPEQCRGSEVDARVDLYACGVMLFEMLTGRKPFVGDDPIAIVRKHLQEAPPHLRDVIPEDFGEVEDVIQRALAKEPGDRYADAAEMSAALEIALGDRRASGPNVMPRLSSQPSQPNIRPPSSSGPSASGWELGSSAIISEEASPSTADAPMVSASLLTDEKSRALSDQLDDLRVSGLGSEPATRFPTGPSVSRASTAPPQILKSNDDSMLETMRKQKAPNEQAIAEERKRRESERERRAKTEPVRKVDPNDRSLLKMLPKSRMKWAVLFGVIVAGGLVYGILYLKDRLAKESAKKDDDIGEVQPREVDMTDPAADIVQKANEMIEKGDPNGALELTVKARKQFPDSAALPYVQGRIFFARFWWNDGIRSFREAIKLDPTYRSDKELITAVLRGFITTPGYDARLGSFLLELGPDVLPYLEETAKTHHNPGIRERAANLIKRFPH